MFLLNSLSDVPGHCKTSWMGGLCSSLSLFSDPVCVTVLLLSYSSRVLGVISAMSTSNVWLLVSLHSWPIFLDSALLHCCYLEVLALLMMFLLMHQSISWVQVLSYCRSLFLSSVISWFPTISSNMLYVMVLFQMVFFHMDISAWMRTLFQKQRRRTQLLWSLLQCLYQIHTHFLPLSRLRILQSLEKIWNMIYHHRKFLLGPEKCLMVFLLLRHLQPAEACNGKSKICYVGKHLLPKKSTIINSLFTIFWYLPHPVWHLMSLYFHYWKCTTSASG